MLCGQLAGEAINAFEGRQVQRHDVDLSPRCRGQDLIPRLLSLLLIAACHDDGVPAGGESMRRGQTDPGVRAGDDHRFRSAGHTESPHRDVQNTEKSHTALAGCRAQACHTRRRARIAKSNATAVSATRTRFSTFHCSASRCSS